MKISKLIPIIAFLAINPGQAQNRVFIPDIKGYKTLQCDFHTHTIFSDGTVWPTVRIDEAYREGLDAISITEHIYQVEGIVREQDNLYEGRRRLLELERLSDISFRGLSHNISYELAQPSAKERNIILIRGSEITRDMPPGHHNAIFINNSDELVKHDFMDAFRAAKAQNAFFFWNHPGYLRQSPDTTLWWPEHTLLQQQGMMQGIEVANGDTYCVEAHRWALEKKLTLIGSSDIHAPMPNLAAGQHRTMTLVFAKERTAESIHEALKERRTAVYFNEYVIGEEKYLKELFESAVDINVTRTGNTAQIRLTNKSDLIFLLKSASHDARLLYFRNTYLEPVTIAPQGTFTISVRLNDGITGGDVNFSVDNFLIEPNRGMRFTVRI